jgi:CSLREA domain-containing protein
MTAQRTKNLRKANARRRNQRRGLLFEPLEDRRLLAVFAVSNLNNAGPGSLRDAIIQANSTAGADSIEFEGAAAAGGTINLASQLPTITDALTINGPGADLLTINAGNGADNTFGTGDGFRIFNIEDGDDLTQIDVTISGLTLTGGDVGPGDLNGAGGAIRNRENLTLSNIVISGNAAVYNSGGGIENRGGLTVASSTIADNRASRGGGGIYHNGFWGSLSVRDSTLSGNTARDGGGIYSVDSSANSQTVTTITNTTLSGNTAMDQGGGTTAKGGGLYSSFGRVVIASSTITSNTASSGGGGGVASSGYASTQTEVYNSIIAGNSISSGNTNYDVAVFHSAEGTGFVSGGYNLIGAGRLDVLHNFTVVGDQRNVTNPLLGPLADNGGPTQTHELLPGSPALDAGDPSAVAGQNGVPVFDQRGAGFGRVFFGRMDIGALERQTEFPSLIVTTTADVVDSSDFETSLREAILLANSQPGRATITFDPAVFTGGLASLIRLTEGPLQITSPVTIDGSTGVEVTISGDALGNDTLVAGTTITDVDASLLNNPASMADNFPVLQLSSPAEIIALTLTGSSGYGLRYAGVDLVLRDSTVSGNRGAGVLLPGAGYGGINAIIGSVISGNRNRGINSNERNLVIYGSTISNNSADRGAGISMSAGHLFLRNSVVSNNKALNGPGGGIAHEQTMSLAVSRDPRIRIMGSTISGNTSHINPQGLYGFRMGGGGIFSMISYIHMYDSTVSGNSVSGIAASFTDPQTGQEYSVPAGGGGIFVRGGLTQLRRSTVTGNSAPGKGGALYAHNVAFRLCSDRRCAN